MSHRARTVPRPPGLRRGVWALALALLTACAGWVLIAPPPAAAFRVAASQPLVALRDAHVARTGPSARARRIEFVGARRPLTRVRTVLPVLGYAVSRGGNSWVHVRLPGRPNGHTGWILARQTRRTSTAWHISLKLSTRRVTVFHYGRIKRRFPAVIGKPATPTPPGRFFIEETLALSPRDGGAPFALATSARSQVLQEFDGGPGQIALHGTNNLRGIPGTAASHGCIRLSTPNITWLAQRIGSGIPLNITR